MSTATDWPNVTALLEAKLTIPVLDNQPPPYPSEWLRERAAKYAADPKMAGLLEVLASYEALNKKLNRQPAAVRNSNIVLHYLVAAELEPKKIVARQRVAELWLVTPETVKRLATEHGAVIAEWLKNLIAHIDARHEFGTAALGPLALLERSEILKALDKDMEMRVPAF